MTTWTVGSNSELLSTLKNNAMSGDTILLESGSYGDLDLANFRFDDYVTIRSADSSNPAQFTTVEFQGSSYLHLDAVEVSNPGNGNATSKLVSVIDDSHHVVFSNSEVHGRIDGEYQGWYGLYAKDSSFVRFENNDIHDVKNGIVAFSMNEIEVVGNELEDLGNDDMKFGGINGALIEDNIGATNKYRAEGAHVDFIQFQGGASDVVIRGNVSLQGEGYNQQGIFLSDASFHNVLVEENIIYNSLLRGISISDGSNIVARDNTVLTVPGQGHKASLIILPAGSVKENNIESHVASQAGLSGSNLKLQWDNPNGPNYYDSAFVNPTAWPDLAIEDLRPVPGSAGETMGAYARTLELLDGNSVSTNENSTEGDALPLPPIDVEPPPAPVDVVVEDEVIETTSPPAAPTDQQVSPPEVSNEDEPIDTASNVAALVPGEPISYWSMSVQGDGRITDEQGVSDAQVYVLDGKSVSLATASTMAGPDGSDALLFGEGQKSFAYAANDQAYQVLNGTVSAWFNPTSLESTQAILSKDERHADDGGHFHMRIEPQGYLLVRVADGDGTSDKAYNHEWRSKEPIVETGSWQHIALSFGVAGIAVHFDGEALEDGQFEKVAGAGDIAMSDFIGGYAIGNDKPFIIGANSYAASSTSTAEELGADNRLTHFFEGGIANIGFWGGSTPDHALSAGEIAGLYATGLGHSLAGDVISEDQTEVSDQDVPHNDSALSDSEQTTAQPSVDEDPVATEPVAEEPITEAPIEQEPIDQVPVGSEENVVIPQPDLVLLQQLLTPGPNNPASAAGSLSNDLLIGTTQNDHISAGWGDDRMSGGLGDDILNGEAGNDVIAGGSGGDQLSGGFGDDILVGEAGHDVIHGGRGADVLVGGSGDDVLSGGTGEDVLYAGTGTNIIDGGAGSDVVVMDGHREDYGIEQSNVGWTVTSETGATDNMSNVEHLYFSGSAQTFALGLDGSVELAADGTDVEEMLADNLLAELLNLPDQQTSVSMTSVDTQLAELAEMELASSTALPSAQEGNENSQAAPVGSDQGVAKEYANEDDFQFV